MVCFIIWLLLLFIVFQSHPLQPDGFGLARPRWGARAMPASCHIHSASWGGCWAAKCCNWQVAGMNNWDSVEWIVQFAVFSASIHQSQFHRASCIALRMLTYPGSSIAWMSTQSYDDDYTGADDVKLNRQEFRAGNIRSWICFRSILVFHYFFPLTSLFLHVKYCNKVLLDLFHSFIKASSRKETRLEISTKWFNRHAAFGKLWCQTNSDNRELCSPMAKQSLGETLHIMYLIEKCFPFPFPFVGTEYSTALVCQLVCSWSVFFSLNSLLKWSQLAIIMPLSHSGWRILVLNRETGWRQLWLPSELFQ